MADSGGAAHGVYRRDSLAGGGGDVADDRGGIRAVGRMGVWPAGTREDQSRRGVQLDRRDRVLGGAFGHRLFRDEVLLVLFGILLLVARTLITRQRICCWMPNGKKSCATRFPRTCWLKVGGMGLVVGAMNGLFGVGGGFLVVPALILILGFPTRTAIGTSLSIIGLISIGGIVGHLQFGRVDWALMGFVLLGSVSGMALGVRMGAWLSPTVANRMTASITITIAVTLIVINMAKLLGVQD